MKIASVLFLVLGVCYLIAGTVYMVYTREPAGFVMLIFLVGFALALSAFVFASFRSLGVPLPEDRADADMDEAAGPIMYFPTASIWPFALALGVALVGLGLIVGLWWTVVGGIVLAAATAGYTRESARAAGRPESTVERPGDRDGSRRV